jgi:hypothetical protein
MPRGIPSQEQFADLGFPKGGIDVSCAYSQQATRASPDGSYARTTPAGVNVRTYEPATNRARGAQRSGLSKYISTQPGGTSGLIQELFCLTGAGYPPPGGASQSSSSGRVVTLVAVKGGRVYAASAGGSAWVAIPSDAGDPPLAATGVVRSAQNGTNLYFADGVHACYFDPALGRIRLWVASAGSLPASGSALPRLICTWRGRTVLAGISADPHNWFMSAVDGPTDWDYAPVYISPTQAVAGNNSPLGEIGDVVTSLIPYTDDVLVMGGDHTVWQFSGDPMAGGQIDLVSDTIGLAWGAPWCKGPDGTLYFVSNRMGIYAYRPGSDLPARISQPIEQLLTSTDTGSKSIRLVWDERFQGLHVFASTSASASADMHLFWEQRAGAWWQDVFAQNNHNPLCACVLDGNTADDRRPLIGSWDGYVRAVDPDASDDDGTAIASAVTLGPLLTGDFDELLVKDVQAVLATGSGAVSWAAHMGASPEAALLAAAAASGTWAAGRNLTNLIQRSGHAIYWKLTATVPWALEGVRVRLAAQGKVRRRGY